MQPQIDIELVTSPFCFLNRQEEFSIYLKYRLRYQEPITISTLGSIFDPAATFAKNRIQVLDIATKEASFSNVIPETSKTETQEDSLVLKPSVESYFFWTISTQPPRWREHPFDISALSPNRKYTLAYRNHGITHWYSESHSTLSEILPNAPKQQGDSIQVNLVGNPHPQFTARTALRPPPPVTASLSTSSPTCDLSGNSAFTVSLNWKLHDNRAIYALVTCERGRNIGLEIRYPEKHGRRIGPPPDLPQGDHDVDAPSNNEEIFVVLNSSGESYSQSYTLVTEEKQGGLVHADTWNLKSGKEYEITLRKSRWRWMYRDEIEEEAGLDEAKVVEILRREPCSEWKPECRAEFRAQ